MSAGLWGTWSPVLTRILSVTFREMLGSLGPEERLDSEGNK